MYVDSEDLRGVAKGVDGEVGRRLETERCRGLQSRPLPYPVAVHEECEGVVPNGVALRV